MKEKNSIQLIRHATLLLQMNGTKILLDPMLSPKEAMDPIGNCGNDFRIPMVDLPFDEKALHRLLAEVDAVFVTHTHRDHWDETAQKLIDKNKPIFCQPVDEDLIQSKGFTNVQPVKNRTNWKGIEIHCTGGQHGTGKIGQLMGTVSGFVFKYNGPSIYVAGDTIWCEEVKNALDEFQPAYTILNTGGAQFLEGDPITMTPEDVKKVYTHLPTTNIVAVHMDTINHCFVKRKDLKKDLGPLAGKVLAPEDGEILNI